MQQQSFASAAHFNPKTSGLVQKCHPYTRNLRSAWKLQKSVSSFWRCFWACLHSQLARPMIACPDTQSGQGQHAKQSICSAWDDQSAMMMIPQWNSQSAVCVCEHPEVNKAVCSCCVTTLSIVSQDASAIVVCRGCERSDTGCSGCKPLVECSVSLQRWEGSALMV